VPVETFSFITMLILAIPCHQSSLHERLNRVIAIDVRHPISRIARYGVNLAEWITEPSEVTLVGLRSDF
jgi:hypothetical protein